MIGMYATPPALESDDELRARVLYVAGDGDGLTMRIRSASGQRLEDIAAALGLKRRRG